MPKIACPACAQPMSSEAVVCPHCGAKRKDVQPGLAGKNLSKEEIRAVLASAGAVPTESRGMLPTVVLPHPQTRGTARAAELALTAFAFPLVLAGVFALLLSGRGRRGRNATEPVGEVLPVVAMAGFGGLGLYTILDLFDVSTGTCLTVIGIEVAALIVRAVIRTRAAAGER